MSQDILPALDEAASERGIPNIVSLDWFNGRRYPYLNENAKSAIYGLSLSADAVELYASLVYATAFGSRAMLEGYRRAGIPIEKIIATGGIAQKSSYVMQTLANVLELPIMASAEPQSCARGSAIYAAVAAGIYRNIKVIV